MPGRFPLFREAGLALFLIAVALGLWLADVRPLAVVAVMALALAVAWMIEWLSWRDLRARASLPLAPEDEQQLEEPEAPPLEEPVAAASAEPARSRRSWYPLRRMPSADGQEEAPPRAPLVPPESVIEGRGRIVPLETPAPGPVPESADAERSAPVEEHGAAADEPPEVAPRPEERVPLRSVPTTSPAGEEAEDEKRAIVSLASRGPRTWNLWELERLAREEFEGEALEQSQFLFIHLRQFARADGQLPLEFDELVRDSFGGLLDRVLHA